MAANEDWSALMAEAKEFSLDLFEFELNYPNANLNTPKILDGVFENFRSASFLISSADRRFELTDRDFIFSVPGSKAAYRISVQNQFFSSISIENGSVKARATVALSMVAAVYTSVAMYPDFREGVVAIYDDVSSILEWGLDKSRDDLLKKDQVLNHIGSTFSLNMDANHPDPIERQFELTIDAIREEEILERLNAQLRIKFGKEN